MILRFIIPVFLSLTLAAQAAELAFPIEKPQDCILGCGQCTALQGGTTKYVPPSRVKRLPFPGNVYLHQILNQPQTITNEVQI